MKKCKVCFGLNMLLALVFIFTGCAMHQMYQAEDDLTHNKYLSAEALPSPDASYVGTWTTNMVGGLVCIRINQDGTTRYCQNKMDGTVQKLYGKIYNDSDGNLYLINETGLRYKIAHYTSDYIDTTVYGSNFRFVPGVKSANCEAFLESQEK